MLAVRKVTQHAQALYLAAGLAFCLLPGCKHTRPNGSQQTRGLGAATDDLPASGPLTVSLTAMLSEGSTERPLSASESLHAGDHLYFLVRASQPAYLYVVLYGPSGTPSILFPRKGEPARIAARCPVSIPAQGSFYLRNPAGNHDLRVIASTEPLEQADRKLCDQLQLPCETPIPDAVKTCPKERARALFPSMQVATATPLGVASLRLVLRQDP